MTTNLFINLISGFLWNVAVDWVLCAFCSVTLVLLTTSLVGVLTTEHDPEHFSSSRDQNVPSLSCLLWLNYEKRIRLYQWHPTPVLLPGKSHGRRSLEGCSPWGRWGSDTTERLHFHFPLSCIGEGNGNPLQCSCLDNPRDGGAWWAAVYGVAQSWTRLKRLNSSSSMLLTSSPVLLVLLMVNIFWVEKLSRYFPIMKKWVSDLKWLVKWSAHLKGCFEKQMK